MSIREVVETSAIVFDEGDSQLYFFVQKMITALIPPKLIEQKPATVPVPYSERSFDLKAFSELRTPRAIIKWLIQNNFMNIEWDQKQDVGKLFIEIPYAETEENHWIFMGFQASTIPFYHFRDESRGAVMEKVPTSDEKGTRLLVEKYKNNRHLKVRTVQEFSTAFNSTELGSGLKLLLPEFFADYLSQILEYMKSVSNLPESSTSPKHDEFWIKISDQLDKVEKRATQTLLILQMDKTPKQITPMTMGQTFRQFRPLASILTTDELDKIRTETNGIHRVYDPLENERVTEHDLQAVNTDTLRPTDLLKKDR